MLVADRVGPPPSGYAAARPDQTQFNLTGLNSGKMSASAIRSVEALKELAGGNYLGPLVSIPYAWSEMSTRVLPLQLIPFSCSLSPSFLAFSSDPRGEGRNNHLLVVFPSSSCSPFPMRHSGLGFKAALIAQPPAGFGKTNTPGSIRSARGFFFFFFLHLLRVSGGKKSHQDDCTAEGLTPRKPRPYISYALSPTPRLPPSLPPPSTQLTFSSSFPPKSAPELPPICCGIEAIRIATSHHSPLPATLSRPLFHASQGAFWKCSIPSSQWRR